MIGNFILQIPDRHNQNGMGGMFGGKPHVVPIDLGWAGKNGYIGNMNMFFSQQFKIDRTFDADNGDMEPDFRKNISNHWSSISDDAERVRQQKVIVDLYDDMIARGKAMTQDKDKFINDLLIGLHDAGNNAIIRNKAEQEARNMLKMMMRSIANMESERDNYLKSIFSIDEAVIKGGA
jgi:chromosome condensin MukBEF ATPase and DNA-binding subunit MukB